MRLLISDNVGEVAAKYLQKTILNAEKTNGKAVLGLPTGSSSLPMYKSLIKLHKDNLLSFKNTITFNMDEYIGLSKDHDQSYHYFMNQNFFNHVDIDKNNTYIPNGLASDIKLECLNYENKIKELGPIDIFVGGVGEDGHIAFNEPYSSLHSETRDKSLNKSTIIANSRFFDGDLTKVPKEAITVGIKTIMSANEVMILVSGDKKALVLAALLEGSISHSLPITSLQLHPKLIVIADEDACRELKVKTYKYFKEMEDEFSYLVK